MPIEGPYKPNPSHAPESFIAVVLLVIIAMAVTALWYGTRPSPPVQEPESIAPTPEPVPDPRVAINAKNIEALAERLEQPTVYRYLDPRPVKLRASRFADAGDRWTGSSSACKLPDDYRRVLPTDYVYAHRDWPCHQLAEICYRSRCIRAIKATSGPFGCALEPHAEPFETCNADRWCWTTQTREDCPYRGQIDIGAAVAGALGMDGIKTVRVRRIREVSP